MNKKYTRNYHLLISLLQAAYDMIPDNTINIVPQTSPLSL